MADECRCLVFHPKMGSQERENVIENLRYARSVGDMAVVPILIEQLSGCPVPQEA